MTPLLSALHTTYADMQGGVRRGLFDARGVTKYTIVKSDNHGPQPISVPR